MDIILGALILAALPTSFDLSMGKQTQHWEYVEKTEDLALLDFSKQLFEKNKEHLNKTAGLYKIPNVIHFIWIGPNPFPPESVENVRSWHGAPSRLGL